MLELTDSFQTIHLADSLSLLAPHTARYSYRHRSHNLAGSSIYSVSLLCSFTPW